MTDPTREEPPGAAPEPTRAGPPGSATFGLDRRAAPGLYLVAWLLTIVGGGLILVSLLAGGRAAASGLLLAGLLFLGLGLFGGAGSQALERRRGSPDAVGDDDHGSDGGAAPYRGPSPFLVFAATIPLTLLLVALLVALLGAAGVPARSPTTALASVLATGVVYLVLVRLLVVGSGALSWSEIGLAVPPGRALRELLAGALLAAPVVLVTGLLLDLLIRVVGSTPEPALPEATDAAGLALNLVTAAIVAPIGEEIFFRGFATTAWARAIGERAALVRGALFFALVHVIAVSAPTFGEAVGIAAVGFAGRLPVAIALGWIFLRRRSLYAAIGLHAAFNGALIVVAQAASNLAGT
ncbi:MAG: Type prenyl endopeptidase Rce1-like [Chloroflexota bacterium]